MNTPDNSSKSSARCELPEWLSGNNPQEYLGVARLRSRKGSGTGWTVQTEESYYRRPADLVGSIELSGPTTAIPQTERLHQLLAAEPSLESTYVDRQQYIAETRERLSGRIQQSSFAAMATLWQLDMVTSAREDVPGLIEAIDQGINGITESSGQSIFPDRAIQIMYRTPALPHRAKLPAVLLRIAQDEILQRGDPKDLQRRSAEGELIFSASMGLSDGVLILDAYVAPLLGALSPHLWAFSTARAMGTVVFSIGRLLPGVPPEPATLLDTLPHQSGSDNPPRPILTHAAGPAAVHWWATQLNQMFAWLSDPVVFTDAQSNYRAGPHLQYLLTIEQVFRRVGSIQRSFKDPVSARTMLFSVLDSIGDRLTGRGIDRMASVRVARAILDDLRGTIPEDAQLILLPAAERAVEALERLKDGFFLQNQGDTGGIQITTSDGSTVFKTLDEAVSMYVKLLRNATHGFGGKATDRSQEQSDALLVHHNGHIPGDLSLLGYLYLLDILAHPQNIRRFVSRRVERL